MATFVVGRLDDERVAVPAAARIAHVPLCADDSGGRPSVKMTRASWIISRSNTTTPGACQIVNPPL